MGDFEQIQPIAQRRRDCLSKIRLLQGTIELSTSRPGMLEVVEGIRAELPSTCGAKTKTIDNEVKVVCDLDDCPMERVASQGG